MYKAGDLVYIPSEVTLTQPINEVGLTVRRFVTTERPVNAIVTAPLSPGCHSQYKVYVKGEHWYVSKCHVYPATQEEKNDSLC
jgi:hypothetical protein